MDERRADCRRTSRQAGRKLVAVALLAMLATFSASPESQAAVVRDLPGISGQSVQIVAAAPGPGGETTIVANIRAAGSRTARARAIRLRADGAPQIGFGKWGVATLPADGRAVAATADPRTGRLYVATISGDRPEVVAIGNDGEPDREFGSNGIVRIAGGAVASSLHLASGAGYLFVSAGDGDCAGCSIKELSLPSGTLATSSSLSRDQLAGRSGCSKARVGSMVLVEGRLLLGADACGQILVDIPQPHKSGGGVLRGARITLGTKVSQAAVGADGGQRYACLAAKEPGSMRLAGARYSELSGIASAGGKAQLDASVQSIAGYGSSGCAALTSGPRGTAVLLGGSRKSPSVRRVPGLSRVAGLAACGRGLLAVGTRQVGRTESARLVVLSRAG